MAGMLPLCDPSLRYEAVLACGAGDDCLDFVAAYNWVWEEATGGWAWSPFARRELPQEIGAVLHTLRLERQDDMAKFVLLHRARVVPLGHSRRTERDHTVPLQRSAPEAERILRELRAAATDGPVEHSLHPGRHVRLDCLEPLGLSVAAGARALGVPRSTLASLVGGRAGIGMRMASRLGTTFGGGAGLWLSLQAGFEIAEARRAEAPPL